MFDVNTMLILTQEYTSYINHLTQSKSVDRIDIILLYRVSEGLN